MKEKKIIHIFTVIDKKKRKMKKNGKKEREEVRQKFNGMCRTQSIYAIPNEKEKKITRKKQKIKLKYEHISSQKYVQYAH